MDLKMLLFNMFFIVVFIMPFILLGIFQQKRKKKLLDLISQLAAAQQCKLTKKDFCGELVIGIDAEKMHLFFVKRLGLKNNQELTYSLNLHPLCYCKVMKQISHKENLKGKQEVIEQLELVFFDGIATSPSARIEFFNKENSLQLSGEYALAEKWETELNTLLSQRIRA